MGGGRDTAKLEVDDGRTAVSALSTNTLGVGGRVLEGDGLGVGGTRLLGVIIFPCAVAFGGMGKKIQRVIFEIR